jgi:hypothetical protein
MWRRVRLLRSTPRSTSMQSASAPAKAAAACNSTLQHCVYNAVCCDVEAFCFTQEIGHFSLLFQFCLV